VVAQNGTAVSLEAVYDYYPYGAVMRSYENSPANMRLYQGKEWHDQLALNWYDFGSRYYDPVLGMWGSVDPQKQFASPYMAMGNNPVIGVDPDGEFWFIPVIIGVLAGGYSGYKIAKKTGVNPIFGALFGATLGGLTAGLGSSISAGIGASLTGNLGGLIGTSVGSALSESINSLFMTSFAGGNGLDGFWTSALSGLVGGAIGSYYSGSGGAFLGGFIGGGMNSALNKGNFKDILTSGITSGSLSYGLYWGSLYANYKMSKSELNWKQFRKMSYVAQRSFARGREWGGKMTKDDIVLDPKMGKQLSRAVGDGKAKWSPDTEIDFHTHPNILENYPIEHSDVDIANMKSLYEIGKYDINGLRETNIFANTSSLVISRIGTWKLSYFGAYAGFKPLLLPSYSVYSYNFYFTNY